jgi:diaminohydroxyphosphoribosylaminopyrimidine deaminase / 5-amino-6-(5-phosphoribosylamino)uracil reductase
VDDAYMRRALDLAERGRGVVSPNPLVGAVVVAGDELVGEGWHRGPGRPHAEIVALEAAGDRARGATLFVTLEPCTHYGRTPPCAPRVIEAGVARVVVAAGDPSPLVDGRGMSQLREAGVEVTTGVLEPEALRQNEAFLTHLRTGRPFVTIKMAASLDGRVAARDGSSRWISGPASRAEVHRMRGGADALMVGAGTAFRDDPALTVRDPDYSGPPPLRVVVDGRGIVPETHRLFTDGAAPTMVVTTEGAPGERRTAWAAAGAEVLVLDDAGSSLVPLGTLFDELGKRDVQQVQVEGGPALAWELVRSGLAHRLILYVAPILLGGRDAPGILMGDGTASIQESLPVRIVSVDRVGDDVRMVADVHGDR